MEESEWVLVLKKEIRAVAHDNQESEIPATTVTTVSEVSSRCIFAFSTACSCHRSLISRDLLSTDPNDPNAIFFE